MTQTKPQPDDTMETRAIAMIAGNGMTFAAQNARGVSKQRSQKTVTSKESCASS
jgi:hypothetical protein